MLIQDRNMVWDSRKTVSPNLCVLVFRSPVHYDTMYRRSPPPQRLPTEPIPKDRSIFRGPEGTIIDLNELQKITVDIRRNLSRGSAPASYGPLKYAFNPADVILVRRYLYQTTHGKK